MSQPPPYESWRTNGHGRWIDAANTFGSHLMRAARDHALKRIPPTTSDEGRALATQAVQDALYGVMMLLDGVASAKSGEFHQMEYSLIAQVTNIGDGHSVERIELAPDGDGLCMGFAGWSTEDFGH